MRSKDLLALLDFLYYGEVDVFQQDLDSFLALAAELGLKGLTGTDEEAKKHAPLKLPATRNIPVKKNLKKTPRSQSPTPKIETRQHCGLIIHE